MQISGIQKLSLIDYPKKIAAIVFFSGCNFYCGFCHNGELVESKLAKNQLSVEEEKFFNFLDSRQGLLDGVCLTGGEPTINSDLPDFIKKIKQKKFLVKLDTNGSNPKMIENLFRENLLDFTAMDIKSSLDRYIQVVGRSINLDDISKSVNLIKQSGVDYEFRTTVIPGVIDEKEIKKIGQWLKGAKHFTLQQFRPGKTLDSNFKKVKPYPESRLKLFAKIIESFVEKVELRGI